MHSFNHGFATNVQMLLWEQQLIKDYDFINWAYKLKLTRPVLRVITSRSYLGQWDPLLRELKISSKLILENSWTIVREILKHEIAHQLVTDRLKIEDGHGPHFKRFCAELGLDPRFWRSQGEINFAEVHFETLKDWHGDDASSESERLLQRVERLLSLAQSCNENEALSAMEKVNELFEKYNLELRAEKTRLRHFHFLIIDLKSQKTNAIYPVIISILMEHYFVDVIMTETYQALTNQPSKSLEIFGTLENLKMAEYVFHFLVQKTEELWRANSKTTGFSAKHKRSFQLGLLHGFNEKLRTSKRLRHEKVDNAVTKSLLLIKQDPELQDFMASRHPRTCKKSQSSKRVYTSAFSAGHSEGRSIVLNKGIEKSASGLAKLFLAGKR
jgi:hypothetical protein